MSNESFASAACLSNVLLVARVAYKGGAETVTLTLARGLEQFGWKPFIAAPAGGELQEAAEAQGTPFIPCDFNRMRITCNLKVLLTYPFAWKRGADCIKNACIAHNIHLIHVHHPVTCLYAIPASRKLGIPIVLHVHETLPAKPLYALALSVAVKYAHAVISVSKASQELSLKCGAKPSRSYVVHNGVDNSFLVEISREIPKDIQNAGPGPNIGVFAVLEPRKAQHIFLEAASIIAPLLPNARFWLVGPHAVEHKKWYVDSLKAQASRDNLEGKVSFVGYQADVAAWLSAMDVVVQPSVAFEAFGMALVESLAIGTPVVATSVGGMPEVVKDHKTGLIVPPKDPRSLAAAVLELLSSDEWRTHMSIQGTLDVKERFSPDVFQQSIAKIYQLASPR